MVNEAGTTESLEIQLEPGSHGRVNCAVASLVWALFVAATVQRAAADAPVVKLSPEIRALLPSPEWEAAYWSNPDSVALLELDALAIARLMPLQAGLRWARCPACDAPEASEPLQWSPTKPLVATCAKCGVDLPNDQYPAKVPPAPGQPPVVPVETIEVFPRRIHTYPYHTVPPERQRYPDERIYIEARRDYAAREALFKAALYAATRWNRQVPADRDPRMARLAAVIVLRFAQAYPSYATHTDQAGQPATFQSARLRPPFRPGFTTGKADWLACFDLPVPLLLAYALVRDDPALDEAGRLLSDGDPRHTIETQLFRASAAYVAAQPEEASEAALYAARGLLLAAQVLNDQTLAALARRRVLTIIDKGFAVDGLWRGGDATAQKRVLAIIDGWIRPLWGAGLELASSTSLKLAHEAMPAAISGDGIAVVSWPSGPMADTRPRVFGTSGVAQFAAGLGATELRLTLDGRAEDRAPSSRWRTAIRIGDMPAATSTLRSESPGAIRRQSPDTLFFAADADFQVACFQSRSISTEQPARTRATVLTFDDPAGACALIVYDADPAGAVEIDFHAAEANSGDWEFAPNSAEPAYRVSTGATSVLLPVGASAALRVHSLGDGHSQFQRAPRSQARRDEPSPRARVTLSDEPGTAPSRHATLFEALHSNDSHRVIARLAAPHPLTLVQIDGSTERVYLIVNAKPGFAERVALPDGRLFEFDGLAALVRPASLVTAGGTFARCGALAAQVTGLNGTLVATGRDSGSPGRGWFEVATDDPPDSRWIGRIVEVTHADGTCRAWTIAAVTTAGKGRLILKTVEDAGLSLDRTTGIAWYHQDPDTRLAGPHRVRVCMIGRASLSN